MPKFIRSLLQFILFTGVGVLILYLVYRGQNASYVADCALKGIPDSECSLMQKLKSDFAGVNYWWILVIVSAVPFASSSASKVRSATVIRTLIVHSLL